MPGTNHSLLESTRELYRGAETTTLCVRWSTTTYSPGDNPTRSLMRQFADSRSFTASNQRKLPSGSFFRISKGECTDTSQVARCWQGNLREEKVGRAARARCEEEDYS